MYNSQMEHHPLHHKPRAVRRATNTISLTRLVEQRSDLRLPLGQLELLCYVRLLETAKNKPQLQ